MSNVMTIKDLLTAQAARKQGEPTAADNETERRKASTAKHQARLRKKEQELVNHHNTSKRRDSPVAYKGGKGYDPLTAKVKGTVPTTRPALIVDLETGELKATDASTFKRKKMSKMEFDGVKDAHAKRKACGCNACKQYRTQAWQFMSKQKDESGELIRTEHPDAKAVKCRV